MSNEILQAVREHGEKFEKSLSEVKAENVKLKGELDSAITELAQKMEKAPNQGKKESPFAKLSSCDGIKAMANGNARNAIVKLEGGIGLLTKSLIVGDVAGSSEDGYSVQPQRYAGMANDPRRPLTLLDYLPSLPVTSNSFEFNRLTGYTSNAGYQTNEGETKPEASVPSDLISANIATIANWVPASEQVLSDAPALQQQVSSLLGYGVRAKLEREIILGAGGAGQIGGLIDSGNYTAYSGAASGDTLADAVSNIEAIMLAAGWRPNLIVVHPNDWRDARNERVDSGAGLYLAGSWRDPSPPSIWNIPVITNSAITAGNILMMDTSQVAVLNRQDVTVEMGRIDQQFIQNVISIRAELRAGLAVFSPGAVVYGDWEL